MGLTSRLWINCVHAIREPKTKCSKCMFFVQQIGIKGDTLVVCSANVCPADPKRFETTKE